MEFEHTFFSALLKRPTAREYFDGFCCWPFCHFHFQKIFFFCAITASGKYALFSLSWIYFYNIFWEKKINGSRWNTFIFFETLKPTADLEGFHLGRKSLSLSFAFTLLFTFTPMQSGERRKWQKMKFFIFIFHVFSLNSFSLFHFFETAQFPFFHWGKTKRPYTVK